MNRNLADLFAFRDSDARVNLLAIISRRYLRLVMWLCENQGVWFHWLRVESEKQPESIELICVACQMLVRHTSSPDPHPTPYQTNKNRGMLYQGCWDAVVHNLWFYKPILILLTYFLIVTRMMINFLNLNHVRKNNIFLYIFSIVTLSMSC